ncbi:MAG: amidohydrolase [Myxococcales bacterium]|jgi:hippurate hydrolase
MFRLLPLIPLLAACAPTTALADPIATRHRATHDAATSGYVDAHLASWLETYRELHAHPELSLHEERTAARVAASLREVGYEVTAGVGGHGVVGVMKNGPGKTLMIRGDMDALPVVEQTGLPYASETRVKGDSGQQVGVMHACGHDIHVTNLLATAAFMAGHRKLWRGTLVILAQPAEELGQGARDMIDDRLFERFPRPDYTLALHVDPGIVAGHVGLVPGWAAANVDSVDVTLHGRGGHGARPHQAVDPVVAASYLVTALQTLVSRRVDPQAPAVVTVGSIHAGTKHNVIPDSAHLQITVRSYSDGVRAQLLDGIRQLARDVCAAHRCPRPPEVTVKDDYTPAVYNDPDLAAAAERVFTATLGDDAVERVVPTMGGEDFGRYSRQLGVPGLLFRLGAVEPVRFARHERGEGEPLPSLHSSKFAPDAERALRTGIRATANLALALLSRP